MRINGCTFPSWALPPRAEPEPAGLVGGLNPWLQPQPSETFEPSDSSSQAAKVELGGTRTGADAQGQGGSGQSKTPDSEPEQHDTPSSASDFWRDFLLSDAQARGSRGL